MAVYNPEALELMQGIYKEVMTSDSALSLSDLAREQIAQEILRMVGSGRCERNEIVTAIQSRVERRSVMDRLLPDIDQPARPHSR